MAQTADALLKDLAKKDGVEVEGQNFRNIADNFKAEWGSKCCSSVKDILRAFRKLVRRGDFVETFDDDGVQTGYRTLEKSEREAIALQIHRRQDAERVAYLRRHQKRRGDYRGERRIKALNTKFEDLEGAYA